MLDNISNVFISVVNSSSFFYQPSPATPIFENNFFENDLAFKVVSAVKANNDEDLYKYGKMLSKSTQDDSDDAREHYALSLYYTHPKVNLSDERKYKKIMKHLKRAMELDPDNKLYSQKYSQVKMVYESMTKKLKR